MNIKDKETIELKYPAETAAGLIRFNSHDMIEWEIGTWNVDFPQPTQEEIDKWAVELVPVQYKLDQRQKRREEYPAFGDQLDSILKYFEQQRLSGVVLTPDLNNIVDEWRGVKDKYPLDAPGV